MSLSTQSRPLTVQDVNQDVQRLRIELQDALRRLEAASSEAAANAAIAAIDRTQREFEQRMAAVSSDQHRLSDDLRRSLNENAESFRKELKAMGKSVDRKVSDVARTIDNVDKKLSRQMKALDKSVKGLSNDVDSILDQFKKDQKRSDELASHVNSFLKTVMRRTDVERFTPETLKEIVQDLQTLSESKLPAQANIAVAHQIIQRIAHMEDDAIRKILKHEAVLASAKQQITSADRFVEDNKSVPVTDGSITAKVPADFWTRGAYGKLQSRLKELGGMVGADKNLEGEYLTDADVDDIISEVGSICRSAGDAAAETSLLATQSVQRLKIARDLVNTLKDSGWDVETQDGSDAFDYLGSDLKSGDMREGVFVIMRKKIDGQVLTTTIVAGADGNPEMVFQNNVEDANPATKQQLEENIASILEHLAKAGYDVGASSSNRCVSDKPIKEMTSAESLKGKCGAQAVNAKIQRS